MQQFIDLGWYTTNLSGELKRLPDGKKTLPIFQKDWNRKALEKRNTRVTELGAVITGQESNIIILDCDNQQTLDLFRALDPDYDWVWISKDKPAGGGSIVYKYNYQLNETYKVNNEDIKLDFFSNKGSAYLPTKYNHTKEPFLVPKDPPKPAPLAVIALLKTLKPAQPIKENESLKSQRAKLAPLVSEFVEKGEYNQSLFKIITPKDFRNNTYNKLGHLHPNLVQEGSSYLASVSAILGADPSISIELYINAMRAINNLWDEPMDEKRLESTIINPMISGSASVDNEPIWCYDKNWKSTSFSAVTLNSEFIESFYDDIKSLYYLINYTENYIKSSNRKVDVLEKIQAVTGTLVSSKDYMESKAVVRTSLQPHKEFGHIDNGFNLFRQTKYLKIINNPNTLDNYKEPTTILKFIETLVPDDDMRDYLLRWVKTKFTTFDYSPVILYFVGAQGSGKDLFCSILFDIIGEDYTARPDTKVFLENFNGWLVDKYFVQLDEYGNKLTKNVDREETLGRLKSYTGSPRVQIRAMRSDGYNYQHCITFILTSNSNPLPIEVEDRRIAYFDTPNKLTNMDWVNDLGGITNVVNKIFSEIQDFCYYLATEVKALHQDDFVTPREAANKKDIIIDMMTPPKKLTYLVKHHMHRDLAQLFESYCPFIDYKESFAKCMIMEDDLLSLCEEMIGPNFVPASLKREIKLAGLKRMPTTKGGTRIYYFDGPDEMSILYNPVDFTPLN